MPDSERILSTLKWIVERSPGEKTEIIYQGGRNDLTRFAHSYIHQNVSSDWHQVILRLANGKRVGVSSLNTIDREAVLDALKNLNDTLKYLPENPFFTDLAHPAEYRKVEAFFQSTADCSPKWRSEKLLPVFKKASLLKMEISGSFSTGWSETAVVNSNGVEAYFPSSRASIKIVPVLDNALGYAEYLCRDLEELPIESLADRAIRNCSHNRNPRDLPAGKYTVILEPECVAEILEWMSFSSLSSRHYLDGASFLTGNQGKKITGELLTLYDSCYEKEFLDLPFDFEGMPRQKVNFITNGIAGEMVFDTLTATEAGTSSTGHAILPGEGEGAIPLNLCIKPGDSSISEMIASCERGIYITKFHYVNGLLDIPKALMTGMTRYGTFLVEDGKVSHPIKNLRWTQGWLEAFSNIRAMTRERKVAATWWGSLGAIIVPGMVIDNFNITGITG